MPRSVQVFEHQTIRVGQALRYSDGTRGTLTRDAHRALAAFCDATDDRYFHCGRHTVRFRAHVGVLQLAPFTLEILPKADRGPGGHDRWHRALVRMLRVVGDLGLEAPDEARLRDHPGLLFELFVRRFLDECDRLLHEGLARAYRTEESNRPAFRGRLRITEHVRRNAANAARFYVASTVFDHENVPNLALHEALRRVEHLPMSGATRSRARGLRHAFPELPAWRPTPEGLDRIHLGRRTARYARALRLARLLLFEIAPDLRHGRTPLLALLFDMNQLWERYVAALARRARLPELQVRSQDSRRFWRDTSGARTLRPDLTLRDADGRVRLVIDTKWKVPTGGRPSSADLKQMYCYHELFRCPRSLLLYPSTTGETGIARHGRFVDRDFHCDLAYLDVEAAPDELASLMPALTPATDLLRV